MATIKDVARAAGVSVGTVSNYLNRTRPVSREASLKIQQAMETLQYSLNLSARNLRTNSCTDIGVILPHFDDSYYVRMFQGMESILQDSGYSANLAFSYDIPETEEALVHTFLKKRIRGLILIPCQPDNIDFYRNHLSPAQLPLVLIDRGIPGLAACVVSFDNRAVVRGITSDLLEKGYRDIRLFCGPQSFECEDSAALGYREAFGTGSPARALPPIHTNMTKEDSFRKLLHLLQQSRPDAVIATSETSARGIVEGLRCLGYTDRDIPVVTLTEEHWNCHTHTIASASASLPSIRLGKKAAGLLLEQLDGGETGRGRVVIEASSSQGSRSYQALIRPPHIRPEPVPERTLRILMMDTPQVHALTGLLRNFEQSEQIRAEVTVIPHQKLLRAIRDNHASVSRAPYDVVMYDIPWLPVLASEGILQDITDALEGIGEDIFLPGCFRYFSDFRHRYYGLPFMYAPQILYYRRDLFENPDLKLQYLKKTGTSLRPPLFLKEYNTIADFFTNQTDAVRYGISIPAAYDECLAPEIYMRLLSYGGSLFDGHGAVCLKGEPARKAYTNFLSSVRAAKPDYRSCTDSDAVQNFLGGEIAMLINYPSFLADVADLRRSQLGSIGYHYVPGSCCVLGGWSLGISRRSTQTAKAVSFLRWLATEQVSLYFALLGGQTAVTSNYTNDELVKLNPWLPLYLDSYQYCKPVTPPDLGNHAVLSQTDIDAVVCRWVYRLLDGDIDVSEAIERTDRELRALTERAALN